MKYEANGIHLCMNRTGLYQQIDVKTFFLFSNYYGELPKSQTVIVEDNLSQRIKLMNLINQLLICQRFHYA